MMGRLRTVRQIGSNYVGSLVPLSFNLSGLFAGIFLASSLHILTSQPWGVMLFPSMLSVRGAIGGLFSGRISTALHIGTIRPSMRHNTRQLSVLYNAVTTLTLISGIVLWSIACVLGAVLIGLTLIHFYQMFLVIMTTLGISLIIVSPVTAFVSIESMKRGADPDIVTYPIISTVADILVTGTYIAVVASFRESWTLPVFTVIAVTFIVITLLTSWRNRHEPDMRETIRETLIVIPLVALFVNISGSALDRISQIIATEPAIYMVYPAIIDTVGDVGSIVGSTATTKLNMGSARPSLRLIADQSENIIGTWAASLTLFIGYVLITSVVFNIATIAVLPLLVLRIVTTNILAVGLGVTISLSLALETYRRGWDPDNFVIPLESTLADAITSVSLLIAIMYVL